MTLYDIVISALFLTESTFDNKADPFLKRVKKDGIYTMMERINKREGKLLARDEFRRALDELNRKN